MPITAARRMYSATAVRPIPTDWAITRALAPQAYFRRRTSRTFRIDNLSAGIGPPPAGSQREDLAPFRLPTTEPASPYPQGGRLRSESVAAFARIGWPLSVGISGRLGSDSAPKRAPRKDFQSLMEHSHAFVYLGEGDRKDTMGIELWPMS